MIRELSGAEPIAATLSLAEVDGGWIIDAVAVLEVDASYVAQVMAEGLP